MKVTRESKYTIELDHREAATLSYILEGRTHPVSADNFANELLKHLPVHP